MDHLRDAAPGSVYVSTPLQSMGTWLVSFSKRVASADGAFLGVVSGFMKPSVFKDMFEKSRLGDNGAIELFRSDGTLVTRAPVVELMFGSDVTKSAFYTQYIARGRDGVTHEKSAVDGADRILAIDASQNFPVATVVSVSTGEVLADWAREAEWIAGGALALVLSIVVGGFRLADRINHLAEERERNAVQEQLAVQYDRFNNAVHNIVQGLAMYDARDKLIACNNRYAEIYGIPPELARPGVTRKQILARRIKAKDQRAAQGVRRQRHDRQRTDGRTHHPPAKEEARRRRLGVDARRHHGSPSRRAEDRGNGDEGRFDRTVEPRGVQAASQPESGRGPSQDRQIRGVLPRPR